MSAPLRAKKKNNTMALTLVGLLVISLTGFGVRSVGSGGAQAVGSVGDEDVTVDTYIRALNNQIRALSQRVGQNVTLEQARAFGVDRQVLALVLTDATLDGENARIGLSVGDRHVKENLLSTEAFQGLNGAFDTAAYEFALEQAGLKPAEYDEILREDSSRTLLQTAIAGGIAADETYALALLKYVGETRDFDWVRLDASMLPEAVRLPLPAEVETHYRENSAAYTTPQKRRITYVSLTPDMLIASIKGTDAELRALYEADAERFSSPARRILDRVVFGNMAEAEAAFAALSGGEQTFEEILTARGLTPTDVDLGEVSRADLGGAAADLVFAMSEPGLAGPVSTTLGPAIFRVNAVLAARAESFESVRDTLNAELAAEQARKVIDDEIAVIDDLLAGGVELEDVAAESEMRLETLDFDGENTDGIAANSEFREAALAVATSDFPEVVTMAGGGIFALRLDKIIAPALQPLNVVEGQVIADWQAAETQRQLERFGTEMAGALNAGGSLADLVPAVTTETGARRDALLEHAPRNLVTEVFRLEPGAAALINSDGIYAVARLGTVTAFSPEGADNATMLENIGQRYSLEVGSDIFEAFTAALQDEAGVSVNQSLINIILTQVGGTAPARRHQTSP